jgi:DNA-binding transcriptional LysR family regulator
MLNLNDFYYFVQVVEKNGFSAAAKALDIPKSSLSRRILELERQLGARLIQRTSRKFVITEVGKELLRHGRAILLEAEAAEQFVRGHVTEPQGAVRMTCSVSIAEFVVADLLPEFMARFPKVDIVQHATNKQVDLMNEGYDLALRAHSQPLPDSSLISRPIAAIPWGLFGSSSYLARSGDIASPGELARHDGLHLTDLGRDNCWTLHQGAKPEHRIEFRPKISSDNVVTLKRAAENGLGIAALPIYLCKADVISGKLVRILPQWTARNVTVTLLSPSRRGLLPSVRALSDFLAETVPPKLSD